MAVSTTNRSIDYNALLTTTLTNQRKELVDQVGAANYFYYRLRELGKFRETSDLGERLKLNLMYELTETTTYAGFDVLPTATVDGITAAFYDWANAVTAVVISGDEKAKNRGKYQLINLLEAKGNQARMSIREFYGKAFLQGNGINSPSDVLTPFTNPSNLSTFITPLPRLVQYDPTVSNTVGDINQSTAVNNKGVYWWRNKTKNSTSSTFAGFRKELRNLYNSCGLGMGGMPDIHLTDQSTFEMYVEMLTAFHHNTSYARADIPFKNVAFNDGVVTWDENVIDAQGGSTTQSTSSGTWYMLNSEFLEFWADAENNMTPTAAQKPVNQDATVAHIMFRGATGTSRRNKHGVMGGIDTAIAS